MPRFLGFALGCHVSHAFSISGSRMRLEIPPPARLPPRAFLLRFYFGGGGGGQRGKGNDPLICCQDSFMKQPTTSRWQICTTNCFPLAPCCLKEDGGLGRTRKMATGGLRGPSRQEACAARAAFDLRERLAGAGSPSRDRGEGASGSHDYYR